MLTMLGIPNCDTIRKARRFLESLGIAYRFRDVRQEPLSDDEWRELLAQREPGELVNVKSPSFRKTGIRTAALDRHSAVAVLREQPSAMKRPVMLAGGRVAAVGFSEEGYARLDSGKDS